jgi:hypothetical protein
VTIVGLNNALLTNLKAGMSEENHQPPQHQKSDNKLKLDQLLKKPRKKGSTVKAEKSPNKTTPTIQAEKLSVGETFKRFTPFLKVYTDYINGYSDASKTLKEARKKNPQFEKWLKEQKKRPECKNLDLASFVVMPVQRIPRYRMIM